MAYTVIKERGRGGFGVVHEVEDQQKKRWALKSFAAPVIPGIKPEDVRARFEREVRYQSEIDHPNVVKIVESNLADDPPWFVMELASCSLSDEIAADRTLGGNPQKPLFDILAGLEAVHDKGFKHRDLNPKNVLKFDGATPRYAISDFGLMAVNPGQTTTLTATNQGAGTPYYQAPECAVDVKRATKQSDIYSFGAILHDIFGAGARVPHTELTVAGPLKGIVEKCTRRNLHRRYQSVALLREELFQVLSTEHIVFTSVEESEIVQLLEKDKLSDEEWDRVFQQLDDNEEKGRPNHAIYRAVSIGHLEDLAANAPELLMAMGQGFAQYAQEGTFGFEYCDIIASKADIFYEHGELDLKAFITIAMLVLGTSHNRWLVEHKFMRMAGPTISDDLANRIRIELEVQGVNFCRKVQHVERSITASRDGLHPILRDLLADCPR